jgi:hypothetical protein
VPAIFAFGGLRRGANPRYVSLYHALGEQRQRARKKPGLSPVIFFYQIPI